MFSSALFDSQSAVSISQPYRSRLLLFGCCVEFKWIFENSEGEKKVEVEMAKVSSKILNESPSGYVCMQYTFIIYIRAVAIRQFCLSIQL